VSINGSCLCGGVRFHIDSIGAMVNCHCSMCRKAHGAAFATFARVPLEHCHLTSGDDLIASYRSSENVVRHFCSACGSPLPYRLSADAVDIPAGLFDDDPGARPRLHIFTASRAPWWETTDDLPQFEGWPPRRAGAA
jgi:hypothetical protein